MMKSLLPAIALASLASAAIGQSSAPRISAAPVPPAAPAPPYGPPVSFETAQALIDRAMQAAAARGWRLAIAVVEPSGELVAFGRMDDTQYGSIYVAQRKASTSARYRLSTSELEERVLAGRLVILANDDTLPFPGGRPILLDGRIVGAIGISGATSAQDDEIALAALASLADD